MTTTAEFQALLAEKHAAIVEMNTNGANDANEARLGAATQALLAPPELRDIAKLLRRVLDIEGLYDHGVIEYAARRLEA